MVRTYFFCVVVVIVFALSGCGGKDTTRSRTGSAAAEGADGFAPDQVGEALSIAARTKSRSLLLKPGGEKPRDCRASSLPT